MSAQGRSGKRRATMAVVAALALAAIVALALVVSAGVFGWPAWFNRSGNEATADRNSATASPTPSKPATAAERLLATASDPATACAVSFEGDGITDPPMLQREGTLLTGLPIPERDGAVFAGWYPTPDAAQRQTDRVNGSQLSDCSNHQRTLYAAWTTPERNRATATKLPILMYHQFTTKPEGENNWLRANFAYIGDFTAQMDYVAAQKFYLPTWDEVNAFIDGKLFLPQHSLVITDDDAHPTWIDLAVPVVTQRKLLATSFVITKDRQAASPSPYVLQRSHTDSMHSAGVNGKGQMVNLTADEIAADLEKSARILGAKEVLAYPFGHYNETAQEGVRQAGFQLARTVEHGYVSIGTDKLALPVIRINYGDGVEKLANSVTSSANPSGERANEK